MNLEIKRTVTAVFKNGAGHTLMNAFSDAITVATLLNSRSHEDKMKMVFLSSFYKKQKSY